MSPSRHSPARSARLVGEPARRAEGEPTRAVGRFDGDIASAGGQDADDDAEEDKRRSDEEQGEAVVEGGAARVGGLDGSRAIRGSSGAGASAAGSSRVARLPGFEVTKRSRPGGGKRAGAARHAQRGEGRPGGSRLINGRSSPSELLAAECMFVSPGACSGASIRHWRQSCPSAAS